ncbi:MAG: pyridoxamine 5'-phosphate oxidase family protein [Actinobacteria bacterium]|nr:pyridoxamine 5'-phosphate oxidase family protein [Actinomycetota bacterium]
MSWAQLEADAPELARLGCERLDAVGLAFLGTLRSDGSPRVSPVEPFFIAGELVLGVMARSGKARDLARDPRCALQSAVTDPNAGEGELKLHGRAVAAGGELRSALPAAWWMSRPLEDADVYALAIDQAVFVRWDLAGGVMTLSRWSPERGATETTRAYP